MQPPKLTLPTLLTGIFLALLPLTGAQAAPLNPGSFSSLGANPFTQAGAYTVDTGATPPTLSGPGITNPIRGAVSSAGVAVFTFNGITLPKGATLSAVRGAARSLALLSQGDEDIEGAIDVSGANGGQGGPEGGDGGADSVAGNGSPGGSVEPGGGGAGGQSGPQGAGSTYGGGGGFGGAGSNSGSASGRSYGDLLTKLEGGSGGGGAGAQEVGGPHPISYSGGPGGGGGGAVELGAVGTVTLGGSVNASGGDGGGPSGGGGAGGGILVHGTDVAVTSAPLSLSAHGGFSASEGGGGRIVLEADGGVITGDIDNVLFLSGYDNSNGQIKTVGTVVPYAEDNGNVRVPHRGTSGVNVTLIASSARPNGSETDSLVYNLSGANGGAQHGTVTLSGSTATYKPNVATDYVGTDTFRFTVYDSTEGLPGDHTGTITVTLTNAAPTVSTPTISPATPQATDTVRAAVTASDADGDPIMLTYVWKDGTVVEQAETTSSLSDTYVGPRAGGDVLTVTVTPKDPHTSGTAKSASVTLAASTTAVSLGASPSPAAVGGTVTINASVATTGGVALSAGSGTLALSIDSVSVASSTSGSLTYKTSSLSAGSHVLVAAFTPADSTRYSGSSTGQMLVVLGNPTANRQSVSVSFNTATALTLTGSDPNSPPQTLTYAVVTGPTRGSLSGFNANTGAVTYTPAAGFFGSDSFTFTVSNGPGTSTPATVNLTVTQAAASDVTAQITLTRGGFRFVRASGHYLQPVTLANTGAALADPVSLVLDGLTGATLVGASGTTAAAQPAGSPYVTLPPGGLAAGASVTVTLEFTAQPSGYTPRVLAGPGAR